jgi:hypothetical protein
VGAWWHSDGMLMVVKIAAGGTVVRSTSRSIKLITVPRYILYIGPRRG